jgi:uncharacterized protein
MPVERVYAHPEVRADVGRVALRRGPLVYCVEATYSPAPPHWLNLPRRQDFHVQSEPDLLGGVVTLAGMAVARQPGDGQLYQDEPWPTEHVRFKAVPYHVWDHREPGEMVVWLPEI